MGLLADTEQKDVSVPSAVMQDVVVTGAIR